MSKEVNDVNEILGIAGEQVKESEDNLKPREDEILVGGEGNIRFQEMFEYNEAHKSLLPSCIIEEYKTTLFTPEKDDLLHNFFGLVTDTLSEATAKKEFVLSMKVSKIMDGIIRDYYKIKDDRYRIFGAEVSIDDAYADDDVGFASQSIESALAEIASRIFGKEGK